MLNRTAEALFWIGRYMERVENHARLIDVYYHLQQDEFNKGSNHSNDNDKWMRIVDALGSRTMFEQSYKEYNEQLVLFYATLDRDNTNSLVSCVSHARNNLRTLREQAPTEMWDVMNSFYLWLREQQADGLLHESPHQFLGQIKNWTNMFAGCINSVMSRQNEWYFIECGRYLERSENTLRILCTVEGYACKANSLQTDSYSYLQAVLKSVSGYQTYRRQYADRITVPEIFEFVIMNPTFPRSIHFAFHQLVLNIRSLELYDKPLKVAHDRIVRKLSKMIAELDCLEVNDIYNDEEEKLTAQLLQSCQWIGDEFAQTFFLIGEVSA